MAPQLQKWLVGLSDMKTHTDMSKVLKQHDKMFLHSTPPAPLWSRLGFILYAYSASKFVRKRNCCSPKSVSDSNRFSQRWRVSRQQENVENFIPYSKVFWKFRNVHWLVAGLHAGPLMVWAPLEQWWWAVWRWEKWKRPTSTTSAQRKHRTRYKTSRAERQSRSLPGSLEA